MLLTAFLFAALLFSLLVLFIISSSFIGFVMTRVPYVRTRAADIKEIVRRVPITAADSFFDLGSGDGKVMFLVEKISGAKVKGFELTIWTHIWSRIRRVAKKSRAEFVYGNFLQNNFSQATVIYCYLYPHLMRMIGEKVLADCKPGTKVVSRDFPIPNLTKIDEWKSPTGHDIYLYRV